MQFFDRVKGWMKGAGRRRPLLTPIQSPDGRIIHVDEATLAYMASSAPAPTQASLDAMLAKARRVRVFDGGAQGGEPRTDRILHETDDAAALRALEVALRIRDEPHPHCMCHGDVALEFSAPVQARLAVIGVHHGVSIRWNEWRDDATLVDGQGLLVWLGDRGVWKPLDAYRQREDHKRDAMRAWERWLRAAPGCIAPYLVAPTGDWVQVVPRTTPASRQSAPWAAEHTAEAIVLMERAYPDTVQRTLVLFRWFGSGSGPWSGYPAYEQTAEELLMSIQFADLVDALTNPDLDQTQIDGAARFLAGWLFHTHRGEELDKIPTPIRAKLLGHVLESADEDKLQRARAAFAN